MILAEVPGLPHGVARIAEGVNVATALGELPPGLDVAGADGGADDEGADEGADDRLGVEELPVAKLVALVAALCWCVVVQPAVTTAAIASRAQALE